MRLHYPYRAVIAAMLLIAQAASAGPMRPQVVVVGMPLVPYVAAILGNAGDAVALLRPEQDAHHLILSPSQTEAIDRADMLVIADLGMSPFVTDMVAKRPKLQVIELSKLKGAEPLPYPQENPWLDAAKKSEPESKPKAARAVNPLYPKRLPDFNEQAAAPQAEKKDSVDPHFWLDPERMAAIAPVLAERFSAFTPEGKATFEGNARELANHLRVDVIPNLRQLVSTRHAVTIEEKEALPFIASHSAYHYFLARFALPDPGMIAARPDDYLGAATMTSILEAAKTTRIRCIMADIKTSQVEEVAKLSGAKILIISPEQLLGGRPIPPLDWIKNDYDRLMYDTAKAFGGCL